MAHLKRINLGLWQKFLHKKKGSFMRILFSPIAKWDTIWTFFALETQKVGNSIKWM